MTHALVTGATGFIGHHLVQRLSASGTTVSCLVRPTSDLSRIEPYAPRFVSGDVTNRECLRQALDGVDVVYHLAGVTKSLSSKRLHEVNEQGTRNVAAACADCAVSPVLVIASSLAAAGPAGEGKPRAESDVPHPVSAYGRSKRAGELAAHEFAGQIPTTIVRPPIVLGEGDQDGFKMFRPIARFGVHAVPSFTDHQFSTIHAEDLANALTTAAASGNRLTTCPDDEQGIYFAAADEVLSYADLGRLIGEVLGVRRVFVVRTPLPMVWMTAGANELFSQILRRPHILNWDKAREAAAGSWACSNRKLRLETGFAPAKSLRERLQQTAQWYKQQGWLKR
jgi:nucleoside-diphosphate-sugar epimerase